MARANDRIDWVRPIRVEDRRQLPSAYVPRENLPAEEPIEVIDLDSDRTQVKPHTWGIAGRQ